jgi:uncharacterized protein YkwD
MLASTPHRLLISAALLLAIATGGRFVLAADSQWAQKSLSAEDRTTVNGLLQKYRGAGGDLEKKQDICLKVLAIGPAAAPLMLTAVERDLQPELRKYSTKFQSQAAVAARQKAAKVDLNRVMETRVAVHDLQKLGDGFTHELIVEKIDPVVQKLKAALVLDRTEVLNKSPDLQSERKKLESYAAMWERCHALMPAPPLKQGPKKGGQKNSNAEKPSSAKTGSETESHDKAMPASFESILQSEEETAASLAIPQDPRTRSILAMNVKLAENLDPEEARAILELNLSRTLLGLPALAIDLRLCEAAREHSQDMERLKFFSHESPVPGKKTFGDRAKLVGATASAENIYAGATSGKSAHEGWFPGHHRNQMGNATRVGVGRSGTHFTQMFGS